jgi:hypothetical protein
MRAILATLLAILAACGASTATAQAPTPLFAAGEPIRLKLRGPIGDIRRNAERSTDAYQASLTLDGPVPETFAVRLSARGLSRRRRDICTFPPLRLEFAAPPPEASLFRGQDRLKLVTHCQSSASFQQYVLLEYAAYRLLNVLTPLSLRVRLATIDYVEADSERTLATRLGFLIEDVDDAARRNGLVELETGAVAVARLSRRHAGRVAVFQYMIGNLDWAMHAGPPGEDCCHNGKLLAAAPDAAADLIPVPYDFDHAGIVDPPYATPPPQVPVASVRVRRYRGFCIHNAEAQAAAAEMLTRRAELNAALASVPQLDERVRRRALAYLNGFFEAIASPEAVADNLLRTCLR